MRQILNMKNAGRLEFLNLIFITYKKGFCLVVNLHFKKKIEYFGSKSALSNFIRVNARVCLVVSKFIIYKDTTSLTMPYCMYFMLYYKYNANNASRSFFIIMWDTHSSCVAANRILISKTNKLVISIYISLLDFIIN